MKRIVCAVGVVVLAFGVAVLAQQKSGSVEQELIDLENGWAAAQVQGKLDLAFLEGILADDFVQTNSDGTSINKAQILAGLKLKEDVITSSAGDDYRVRVYGDAAVVTGRWTGKQTSKGKDTSGQYRWTDTWIKTAGRWQCVASHNSKIS
jgi:ketosteroid isomerase-like protein